VPIVRNHNAAGAALLNAKFYLGRTGIDGVFKKLLDRRSWALDHFASRNLADQPVRQGSYPGGFGGVLGDSHSIPHAVIIVTSVPIAGS